MNNCFPWTSQATTASVISTSVISNVPITMPPIGPFPGFPTLNQPRGLTPPFIAPHLIVFIDSSNPNLVIGNQHAAQISLTRSTLFVFNVEYGRGNTCKLVFALPPTVDPNYVAPYTFSSPGGIAVSRLDRPADGTVSASSVGGSSVVGSVPQLLPGNKYVIQSGPCEYEQLVGYRVDLSSGLDLQFFQMTSPALGLFIEGV
jgi:hypothetical protein